MLRIAIPYGLLASRQLRALAHVTRTYDRGTGHFSTRQNLQLNWPKLEDVPEILAELATVQMHAIQTSGNCVRNITTRSLRRHRARRDRRSARVVRDRAPVVDVPSRVHLPAAQVQDRDLRAPRTTGPRCRCTTSACRRCATQPARSASACSSGGGMGRTPILGASSANSCRGRICSRTSKRSCASTTATAAATTSGKRASRSW